MKQILTSIALFLSCFLVAQKTQTYAPWAQDAMTKNNNNPTLKQVSEAAEAYFETIDKDKKGSGLKPFERWRYHWEFFLDENGRIQPKEDLWKAWEAKNQMKNSQNRMNDVSNWISWGPYDHTNTASWSSGQGRINAVTVDPSNPSIYYVGAPAGGIWKSTDSGINWTPLTDYLPQIGVSGIAVDPENSDIIYIATGDDDANDSYSVGVWKSIDGGITWDNTGSITGNPSSMNEIFIYPNDSNTLIVATNTGVHKSTDGGATWVRKLSGNARSLKMRPNDPTTWYTVTSNTFLKSTDSGETFQPVSIANFSSALRLEIEVTPANPDVVYILRAGGGYNFGGIFKSSDRGDNFTRTAENSDIFQSTQAWFDMALTVSDTDEDIVFVGVLDIWKSTDGGDDFIQLNQWNNPNGASYTHADIHILKYIDGKFFAGTDGGIYVSEDDGTNFTDLTKTLAIGQFYRISVAIQNSGNIAGGLQDNGGYALSDNEWKNYYGADGMDCVINPNDPDNYYGFTQNGGGLYETRDGGRTRTGGVGSPESGNWVTPMAAAPDGTIYAGYSQVFSLRGNQWRSVSNHNFDGNLDVLRIDPNNGANIYAARESRFYKSINSGEDFQTFTPELGGINTIEVNSTNPEVVWLVTNSGVYKIPNVFASTLTYDLVGTNTPSESKLSLKFHERSGKNTLYLGTSLGVYSIDDDSTEWETFDNNLPNVAIRDLEINEEDAKLYAGTYGRGVFVSDIPRELPPTDVRILSVKNPKGINCGINIFPEIVLKNQGADILTSATITYSYDGGSDEVYNWTGSLSSEETVTVSLPEITLDLGAHDLNVEVTTSNDEYYSNNTLNQSFFINQTSNNPTVVNSFENTEDALLSANADNNGSLWVMDTPNKSLLNLAATGSMAYLTGTSNNYPNNTTSYLYTNCYDLSQVSTPVLSFKMAFDIEENWDYLLVEYSTDQGNNWQTLGSANDPNWYNSSSTANGIPGNQWTGEGEDPNSLGGDNATIHDYNYDLSAFTTENNMLFRFVFRSDQAVTENGVMIDDLVVQGVLSTSNEGFSNQVIIAPNPSDGIFNIKIPNNINASIRVYNYLGQIVKQEDRITDSSHALDMSKFSSGVYILKILSEGKTATKKILLE